MNRLLSFFAFIGLMMLLILLIGLMSALYDHIFGEYAPMVGFMTFIVIAAAAFAITDGGTR